MFIYMVIFSLLGGWRPETTPFLHSFVTKRSQFLTSRQRSESTGVKGSYRHMKQLTSLFLEHQVWLPPSLHPGRAGGCDQSFCDVFLSFTSVTKIDERL